MVITCYFALGFFSNDGMVGRFLDVLYCNSFPSLPFPSLLFPSLPFPSILSPSNRSIPTLSERAKRDHHALALCPAYRNVFAAMFRYLRSFFFGGCSLFGISVGHFYRMGRGGGWKEREGDVSIGQTHSYHARTRAYTRLWPLFIWYRFCVGIIRLNRKMLKLLAICAAWKIKFSTSCLLVDGSRYLNSVLWPCIRYGLMISRTLFRYVS